MRWRHSLNSKIIRFRLRFNIRSFRSRKKTMPPPRGLPARVFREELESGDTSCGIGFKIKIDANTVNGNLHSQNNISRTNPPVGAASRCPRDHTRPPTSARCCRTCSGCRPPPHGLPGKPNRSATPLVFQTIPRWENRPEDGLVSFFGRLALFGIQRNSNFQAANRDESYR